MSNYDLYENLEDADGNDIIDELNSVKKILWTVLEQAGEPTKLVEDFEELVTELTKREEL